MPNKDSTLAAGFLIILVLNFIFNSLFWIVYCRRQRLHVTALFRLLFALSLVDVFAGGIWTCLSAVASLIGWDFPPEVCRLQSYLLTFTQIMTASMLATVALERLLRMVKPSRHKAVFVDKPKVTVFIILGLCVYCGVISSIHLYGFISVSWHPDEHQCGADFTESIELLNMIFSLDYAIPYWVIALPVYIAAFIKVFWARKHPTSIGEIVLEKNSYAPSDSYSARLSKLQSRFVGATNSKTNKKGKKPTLGQRVYSRQGYTDAEHWDSDIDEGFSENQDDSRKRLHSLPRPEYSMLKMAAIATLIIALIWFPWVVVRFVWNKTPREKVPDVIAIIAILCMHSAAFVKPILYFILNPFFRSAVFKTFCGGKRKGELLVPPRQASPEEYDNMGFTQSN